MTPERRRHLQEQWERGRRLARNGRLARHRREGLQLLADCVAEDPANRFYVELLLSHAETYRAAWWRRLLYGARRLRFGSAATRGDWASVLRSGPALLLIYPRWRVALLALARACRAVGAVEAERAYLRYAASLGAHPESLRALGQSLMRAGDYAEAHRAWATLLQGTPDDPQGRLAADLLRDVVGSPDEGASGEAAAPDSRSVPTAEDISSAMGQGRLADAERWLQHARTASPGDVELMRLAEQWMVANAERNVVVAKTWWERYPEACDSGIVSDAEANLVRVRLDIASARGRRQPGDLHALWELAESLRGARRWSEAIDAYQRILREDRATPVRKAETHLALGESLQQMRRFTQALDQYRHAAAPLGAPTGSAPSPTRLMAMYRLAVLAEALGRFEEARAQLTALLDHDPGYRDAASRLDKLASIRHKD